MRKLLASLGITLLLSLGLAASTSGVAEAHAGCLSNWACMHFGPNYTQAEAQYPAIAGGCQTFNGTVANNTIESIYGNYVGSGKYFAYWNSHNCTGTIVFWSSGGAYATLPVAARNTISSFRVCNGPC